MRDRAYAVAAIGRQLQNGLRAEYEARAFYNAMAYAYGGRKPLPTLVDASEKRIGWLTAACRRYGIPCPPDNTAGRIGITGLWREDCCRAASAELASAENYRLCLANAAGGPRDLQGVFDKLFRHTVDRLLPALQRAIAAAEKQERFHAAHGIPRQEAYLEHGIFSTLAEKMFSVLGADHSISGWTLPLLRQMNPLMLGGVAFGGAVTYALKKKSLSKRKGG